MVLSKNNIKIIRSLRYKKFRAAHRLFVAEGEKTVNDLLLSCQNRLSHYRIDTIYATRRWDMAKNTGIRDFNIIEITEPELEKISFLSTPNKVLALVAIPDSPAEPGNLGEGLSLAIETIQDPGNLGTIIRLAHWFGVGTIILSKDSVDLYNPKTIQSSMGSFWNVNVIYTDLKSFIENFKKRMNLPVYGTFLSGTSIFTADLKDRGIILLGNESKGISGNLIPLVDKKITIPSFSLSLSPDSLNVAQAAAIICAEFRRRIAEPE